MNSPYSPPKSVFVAAPGGNPALRWGGAAIFALIPALMLVVFQGQKIYSTHGYWGFSKVWEPTIYLMPAVVFAALVGYAAAQRCVKASLLGILPLAAAIGVLMALGLAGAVFLVMTLTGQPPRTPGRAFLYFVMMLVPLSIVLCAVTRFYGRSQGFLPEPGLQE